MGISASRSASASRHRRLRLAPLALLAAVCGSAAGAVTPVNLLNPGYGSTLYAYGDYPTPTSLDQNTNAPITLTMTNTVQRVVSGAPVSSTTYASTTTSNDHGGSVLATAHTGNYAAVARGTMYYYFTITGPDADFVPITINGFGSVDVNGFYNWEGGFANMQVNYLEKGHQTASTLVEHFDNHQSGSFSDVINVQPNLTGRDANSISMISYVSVGDDTTFSPYGSFAGSGTAYIDPIISIADPRLASLYTITYGLADFTPPAPSGAVPEPASWALMVGGFGLVGGTLRRRRPAAACA